LGGGRPRRHAARKDRPGVARRGGQGLERLRRGERKGASGWRRWRRRRGWGRRWRRGWRERRGRGVLAAHHHASADGREIGLVDPERVAEFGSARPEEIPQYRSLEPGRGGEPGAAKRGGL